MGGHINKRCGGDCIDGGGLMDIFWKILIDRVEKENRKIPKPLKEKIAQIKKLKEVVAQRVSEAEPKG
jgi:hypothetical protein